MTHFLTTRRFWPLFSAQSLGAFADNTLRYATIAAVTIAASSAYGTADFTMPGEWGRYAGTIVSMAFTLPVLMFSVISGQLADKVDRQLLVRVLKGAELVLMAFAAVCFALGNALLLIFSLFLMGTQSAFFSPVRNALMPQYYRGAELPQANGYFNAALFVATITGLIIGAAFIDKENGRVIVAAILIAAAAGGALFALLCPAAPAPGLEKIRWNVPAVAVDLYKETMKTPGLIFPMIGIGWFWMIGAANLAVLPNFVTETLGGTNTTLVLALALSAIGAGLGSIISGLLAARMKDTLLISGIGVAGTILGMVVTYLAVINYDVPESAFLSWGNAPLLFGLIFSAAANGAFAVPIMSALQARTPVNERAQIMGTSNMTNGGMATFGAFIILPLLVWGLTPPTIFLIVAGFQVGLLLFMIFRRTLIRQHGRIGDKKAARAEAAE